MNLKYLILPLVLVFLVSILYAQNYSELTLEELINKKNEAVKNEQYEKAAQLKKELESRGFANKATSAEPSAELNISTKYLLVGLDIIVDDIYVGSFVKKNLHINIAKIPEGISTIKFISFNNKHVFEKDFEFKAGSTYSIEVVFLHPKNKSLPKHLQKGIDDVNAEQIKGTKGILYIKFDKGEIKVPENATIHHDLNTISYTSSSLGATKAYWYIEMAPKGFNKRNGYSYNQSFGAKQPFIKHPNSGLIWGIESNVWFSEDIFPDGTGYYSGVPTTVSLNYLFGYQMEFLDFIIFYSTGSIGPAAKGVTEIESGSGVSVVTKDKWGVGIDSSADVGLIFTFGSNSRKGISLETNYNSHTGSSFSVGFVFGITKVLKRNTLY